MNNFEFRDFNESDWLSYSGADADSGRAPRIAELTLDENTFADFVIDDNSAVIFVYDNEGVDCSYRFVKDWFKSREAFEEACCEKFSNSMSAEKAMEFIEFISDPV